MKPQEGKKAGGETKGLFLQLQPPHGSGRRGGILPLCWLPPAAGAAPIIPRGQPQTPGPAGLLQGVSEARGSVWHVEGKAGKGRRGEGSQGPGVRAQRGIGAGTRGLLSGEGSSVPCRCPPPWLRHSGGCRRRGPSQGPSPGASSKAGGGAARSSGGGCRCRRRTPRERRVRREVADGAGGSLRPPPPLEAPTAPPASPSRSAPRQPRLRLPRPPRHPTHFIGRIAQAPALGCFRRRSKSASPRFTRRECQTPFCHRYPLRSAASPAPLTPGPLRSPTPHHGCWGRSVTQGPGDPPVTPCPQPSTQAERPNSSSAPPCLAIALNACSILL